MSSKKFIAPILLLLIICGCNEPKQIEISPIIIPIKHLIVLNEGGFTYNNSEISIIDLDSNKIYNDIFFQKNNKEMGDVLQSVTFSNNQYYWVMNNSRQIIITDTNFVQTGKITGLNSPRYMCIVNTSKAYVSDFTGNKITILNLINNQILGYINCKGFTEKFIPDPTNKAVWVSNRITDKIYKIDIESDILIDSMTLSYGPSDMAYDKDHLLWVSCAGDEGKKLKSSLFRVDLNNKTILKKLESSSTTNFWTTHLCFNSSKDTLFWIDAHLKKMAITESVYPLSNFIESNGRIFYGLNTNPLNDEIYLTDAVDYSQNGYLLRFDKSGQEIGKYKVGIIPNGVFLKH